MQFYHKHSFKTVLCFPWTIKKNGLPQFFRVDDDITVPHSTTPWDTTTERGTHYSVSQHHIVRPEDRERYPLQCLTAPHRTTWQQKEVHITVSHIFVHNIVLPKGRKKKHLIMSHRTRTSKNNRQVLASLRCYALSSSFYIWKYVFEKFRMPVCGFACNAWFSCSKFSHAETSVLLNSLKTVSYTHLTLPTTILV